MGVAPARKMGEGGDKGKEQPDPVSSWRQRRRDEPLSLRRAVVSKEGKTTTTGIRGDGGGWTPGAGLVDPR